MCTYLVCVTHRKNIHDATPHGKVENMATNPDPGKQISCGAIQHPKNDRTGHTASGKTPHQALETEKTLGTPPI